MDNYFIPIKCVFNDKFINVLNIESGIEFFADDIYTLVCYQSVDNNFELYTRNLSTNFQRSRVVLIDGLLCDKQTLSWLALKRVFRRFEYDKQAQFIRWVRKTISPALALDKPDNRNLKVVDGINNTAWFFLDNAKSIDSLVSTYQPNLPAFFDASQHQTDMSLLNGYDVYLQLLKKELTVPDYQILYTSDLSTGLLRQRYLETASIILGVNNVEYFNMYNMFVCARQDLMLAQELDIAIIFALKKKTIPYLMLQVIEGGFFLQSLLACTLVGDIDKHLSLSIKQVYMRWLNQILVNITS